MNKADLSSFYENELKRNTTYLVVRKNNTEYCLVSLGTSNFILVHNYYGVMAYGKRKFDFDKKNTNYEVYAFDFYHLSKGTIEYILKKYEKNRLRIANVEIKFEDGKEN